MVHKYTYLCINVMSSNITDEYSHRSHILSPCAIYVAMRGKIFLRVVYNVEIFSTNIFIQSKILRFHEILYP